MKSTHARMMEEHNHMDVNCGGFALNYPRWLDLKAWERFNAKNGWFCPDRVDASEALEEVKKELLRRFSTLRLVQSESELKENEYLIAFRMGVRDFHFKKKVDGTWYEKCGWGSAHEIPEKEVFGEWPDNRYYSEMLLFAKRN